MSNTNNWPKEVPILEARNIKFDTPIGVKEDCRCLVAWIDSVVPYEGIIRMDLCEVAFKRRTAMCKALVASIRTIPKFKNYRGHDTWCLVNFNDKLCRDKKIIARVWNRAMALLGYVEGNPQARAMKRKRTK